MAGIPCPPGVEPLSCMTLLAAAVKSLLRAFGADAVLSLVSMVMNLPSRNVVLAACVPAANHSMCSRDGLPGTSRHRRRFLLGRLVVDLCSICCRFVFDLLSICGRFVFDLWLWSI